jgi:UDP-glucuronate decarboxylase
VHDLVTGLIALMNSDYDQPVNLGSEDESTIEEWATLIRDKVEQLRADGEIPPLQPRRPSLGEEGAEEGEAGQATPPEPVAKRSEIKFVDAVVDDPPRRKPDISRAREVLGWQPTWTIEGGIEESIRYFAAIDA